MNAKHVALLSLLVAAATLISIASRAPAQAQQGQDQGPSAPLKIATANTSKIFRGMKETTDVQARLDAQRKALAKEEQSRRQKVEDLRSQLELLNPDAPQYEQANQEFMEEAIEFKNWGEVGQAQLARVEKVQSKMLFDKITSAIAELAKERGIDLVVAEQPAFNIERMTSEQLTQAMAQRQVLYTSAAADLTGDVIARLDEQFNAAKK